MNIKSNLKNSSDANVKIKDRNTLVRQTSAKARESK